MWGFLLSVLFILWGFMLIKIRKEGMINDRLDWIAWITGWVFEISFLFIIYILILNQK